MKATLQITLNTGIKINTSREVELFTDVGQFGHKIQEWVAQVKRIAPDLAGEKVEAVYVLMEESGGQPKRKRNRKPASRPALTETTVCGAS